MIGGAEVVPTFIPEISGLVRALQDHGRSKMTGQYGYEWLSMYMDFTTCSVFGQWSYIVNPGHAIVFVAKEWLATCL